MMTAETSRTQRPDPPALAEAIRLLEDGLWPLPITANEDRREWVRSPGKQPAAGRDWGKLRWNEGMLRAFWREHPNVGVGLKLGKAGRVVDIETDDPATGEDTFLELCGGEVAETRGFSSGRGPHRLYLWDDRLAAFGSVIENNALFPGLGLRFGSASDEGEQIQSVVPPSPITLVGEDGPQAGRPREWNGVATIARLPEEFFAQVARRLKTPEPKPTTGPRPGPGFTVPPIDDRPERWDADDVKAAILPHTLGLAKEWGLRVVSEQPNAKGFVTCRAIGREDRTPSAALNLQTGVYTDRGTGMDLSLFQLAIALGAYPDFPSVVNELGARFHIPPAEKANKAEKGPTRNGSFSASSAFSAYPLSDFDAPVIVREWPDPPDPVVYHGLPGAIVRAIEPHTESDPVAILVQLLVAFGSLVGRTAHWSIEADRHFPNLFMTLVGQSSKARKGTSWGHVRRIFEEVDPAWTKDRILSGLSSGEGLIWAVRNPISRYNAKDDEWEIIDPGVADKRAMIVETELASALKVMSREGNTLSARIREAWDTGDMHTLTKNSPACATGAHISLIAHITRDEVARLLNSTEAANGFGNRFLWFCVRRSKSLPFGGDRRQIPYVEFQRQLRHFLDLARERESLTFDGPSSDLWRSAYEELSAGKPGFLGSILGRGEAQVMRLALIYALLDGDHSIRRPHLAAALALWKYAEDSARYVFGATLGDPDAERVFEALKASPDGLTQTDISSHVFQKHKRKEEIASILVRLLELGRVRSEQQPTGGRPRTIWFVSSLSEKSGESGESPPS